MTTTTCAVRAQDFSARTTDANRDRWTVGKLRHVIAALFSDDSEGAPVVVTIDRGSGHTLVGVRLLACYDAGPSRGSVVRVASTLDDGTTHLTEYRLAELGDTIIPLANPGRGVKWDALDSYRNEVSAAIAVARAEHGEAEGRGYGAWNGECADRGVAVTYTPQTGNPANAHLWGTRWYGTVVVSADTAEVTV